MTDTHRFPCGCEIPIIDGHPQINYEKLNYDCPKTWAIYCNGQTQSVFQLEKYLGKHWSKKCKPSCIEDASAIIAAIRPGVLQAVNADGISMTEIYAKSKNGEITVENLPILEPVLEETSGVYLFQEQIMAIARDIAGFDGAAQNKLRKGASKKSASILNSLKEEFINGCKSKGIVTEEQANFIFDQFRESARYLFNKSHSVGYAITGYWTAWVKAHLPRHYICAWLRIAKNEQKPLEEIRAMISEARRLDIPIISPSIRNIPETDFFVKNGRVYFGIASIKNCSEKAVAKLMAENLDLENVGWTEFLIMHSHLLSKTQITSMIQVGCFDYMGEERMRCEFEYQQWSTLTERQKKLLRALYEESPTSSFQELLENFQNSTKKCPQKDKNLVHIGRALHNPPFPLVDSKSNIVANERALLGINVSCSKVDKASMPDARDTCMAIAQKNNIKCNKYKDYVIIGEITDYHEFKIKNGKLSGKLMASFKLVDETGECDVVIFPEKLDLYQAAMYDENTVLIKGKISNRGGLICDEVYEV